MPISINSKDFNLQEIYAAAKLQNTATAYNFRLYGLKNSNNPAVLIGKTNFHNNNFDRIAELFNKNKISLEFESVRQEDNEKNFIYIGLRHDLRHDIGLSAAIVTTIIHQIEGNIKDFDTNFKIKTKSFKKKAAAKAKN